MTGILWGVYLTQRSRQLKPKPAMKITKKQIDEVLTVITHVRIDIGYGAGGTFSDGDTSFDAKEAKKAERGIEVIKSLVMNAQV